MKKGTKVYFYKTTGGSTYIPHVEEGTFVGIREGEAVIKAPRKVGEGIQYKQLYEIFTSKEECFDAVSTGSRVWIANRDTLEIVEGRFDIVRRRPTIVGTKEEVQRFSNQRTFATVEDALRYLDKYLTENVANRLHRVREAEKNLKAAMNDHKEQQALLSRVRERIQGKNRLMSFRPKKSSTTKRRSRDYDDED